MKIFFPIIHNGMGFARVEYAFSLIAAMGGRNMDILSLGYPYPDGAMNIATAEFLKSDCDVMLVIDLDLKFSKEDVDRLLAHSKKHPLVFGCYCKKQEGMELALESFDGEIPKQREDGLWSVKSTARGFMAVRREVFEKMKSVAPIYQEPMLGNSEQRIYWQNKPGGHSEDFAFCETWRSLGGEVIVDPLIFPRHIGSIEFPTPMETAKQKE